jgi:SAM-dependent MidA family methyltransferase
MATETPLTPIIREEIRAAGGRITFARFMELCLYHPQHGYYNTERVKLGARGDFFTNAHAGPVFARLLAIHFHLLWHELGKPARFDLVELGPGDGALAAELLPWIAKRFPEFAATLYYTAVEQSPVLRTRLGERLAPFADRVRVLDTLPSGGATQPLADAHGSVTAPPNQGIVGGVLANEFFDALPVHIMVRRKYGWGERYVCLNHDAPAWCEHMGVYDDAQRIAARNLGEAPDGFIGEVCVAVDDWMGRIDHVLRRGEFIVIDYGYNTERWRENRLPQGTALAYREHQTSEDLLAPPGEQDLTAHVNFTHLKESARRHGLETALHMSQAKFLMELGEPEFHDVFADCANDLERQKRAQLLKTLILPQGMGETFHVLQFRKGM